MSIKRQHLYNFAPKLVQRKMKKLFIPLFVVFFLFLNALSAQENTEVKQLNIFEKLAKEDSITHANVKLHQDKRIESLLVGKKTGNGLHSQTTMSGYRVQVFSSNTQRTAKSEAFKKERQIKESFPDQGVYVNYNSPFWKVRVGDFRTQEQAQRFKNELINAFPNMRSEAYIVREQILSSGSK